MSRRALPLALAVLVALGAGSRPAPAADGAVTVQIDHFAFDRPDITVEAGTIVEWVNRDQTIHNIVLTTAKVASPGLDTGDHYTFRFDSPGDFPYLCALHPHMTGTIHVKPHA